MALRILAAALCGLALLAPSALGQTISDFAGDWKGTLSVGPTSLRVGLHVGDVTTFDSLDQGAKGLPAASAVSDGKLMVTITGLGSYEAELSANGHVLAGILNQRGAKLPLNFERGMFETAHRPQTPLPPFPYGVEDVAYDNAAASGVHLAGTLTLPSGEGPFPAALLITGSGAQDRDSTIFEHKPFLVVADYLTRNGIAVLRVDDRGTGKSSAAGAGDTSADYAGDVAAGVAFLRTRPEIDPARIGMIGHSEGGMIAPMVASKDPSLAFVILWAGQGVPGADVIVEQVRIGAASAGANPEQVEAAATLQANLLAALKDAPDETAAYAAALKVFADSGAPAPPESELRTLTIPWYRFYLGYDPAPALKAMHMPVLALLGEKDEQVTVRQNLPLLQAGLAENPKAVVEVLPGLNHLFQTATTGSTSEYKTIEETISPVALERMASWIHTQVDP